MLQRPSVLVQVWLGKKFQKFFFANFLGSRIVDSKNGKKIFLKILPKNVWVKFCEKNSRNFFSIFFLYFWNLHIMIRENWQKKIYFSSPLSETTVQWLSREWRKSAVHRICMISYPQSCKYLFGDGLILHDLISLCYHGQYY